MESANMQGVVAFVHVIEAGSFTAAGERLRVTKSAIGKSIAQLEQRLGVRLLNRTTRSLSPTSEGLSYYEACVRAVSEIEAAQSLLASRRQVPSGRLRVDLPTAFGRRCVAPVLFDISRRYPDLAMEISFNDRRVDLIEEGIDLAIRMGDLDDSLSLAARRLYAQRSAICAAPAYLDRRGRPRTVEELAGHDLIGYTRNGVAHPWLVRHADGHIGKFTPRAKLVLDNGEPMLDAALAGCGITFLPTWLTADSLKRGELEMVLYDRLIENIAVHAIWPVTRAMTPKVRVVVDALVEHFSAPAWDAA
ncbi:MAG: LysR family transcriptional regulator [Mesorhizobium sp.]|nr:LysR family transcriptional regulator [bacterium M00.F.Ca.ET.205.01.1.1]TGU55313.1 LysR family transcriptional regulator [bacterium M00.F.Ca.ET.152.01.1.1]TGV40397.1 LysR family transcriptional regulator [Mesorhizobium sp. M00.F.Ca.ET.186.01.1.1]TGZ45393.1 LysR family transcriptional regulator [bacterium M00.F.Ca.ET.162.01.1.1]TJW34446.1 MAG: LysR family transcriptional regulator [Mesorhizobium sp.]